VVENEICVGCNEKIRKEIFDELDELLRTKPLYLQEAINKIKRQK
jgi:hypothetical protein